MRYVTWLVRWYQWSHRPLPLVLLIACGVSSPLAARDERPAPGADERAERVSGTSAPAPVLRLTREQPNLDMPVPAEKPPVRASSRRTLQASPGKTSVLAAPRVAKTVVATQVTAENSKQPDPTAVSSDGWVARGSSTKIAAKQFGLQAPQTAPRTTPPQVEVGKQRKTDPPSLTPPATTAPATTASSPSAVGGASTSKSTDRAAVRVAPLGSSQSASGGLKPVPRLVPPAEAGRPTSGRQPAPAAGPADPVKVETLTFPRRILPAEQPAPVTQPAPVAQPAPVEQPRSVAAESVDSPIGSGLVGPVVSPRVNPSASNSRRQSVEMPAELPVRRPKIEPLRDKSQQDRGRALQEQIEQFERETSRQRDPASEESYDRPSIEPESSDVEESFPESPRQPAAPVVSAAASRLERPIAQCLQYYYNRPENARERTPWGMLHAIIPYGLDAMIDTGRARYSAIAWLAGNNPNRNLRMFTTTRSGQLVARSGVGLQGHQAQTLAIFAQVGVPQDYAITVNKRKFTVMDLVKSEMAACKTGEELTFTLIGLTHYLPTDTRWRTADGEVWDIERLIREELSQPVVGAACGGTHRLMGFTYALKQRRLEGLPITGEWLRAEVFIEDFINYAWSLQNRDGSFSTDWFEGRADNNDLDRKVQTSGHIMEWLLFASTAEQLNDERVIRGVTYLANAMIQNRRHEWQVGPKGHAIRALSLYHRLVFDSRQPWKGEVAQGTDRQTTNSGRRR